MADKIENGGSAFPDEYCGLREMTLRDYFAAQALVALVGIGAQVRERDLSELGKAAYEFADAMLKARKR